MTCCRFKGAAILASAATILGVLALVAPAGASAAARTATITIDPNGSSVPDSRPWVSKPGAPGDPIDSVTVTYDDSVADNPPGAATVTMTKNSGAQWYELVGITLTHCLNTSGSGGGGWYLWYNPAPVYDPQYVQDGAMTLDGAGYPLTPAVSADGNTLTWTDPLLADLNPTCLIEGSALGEGVYVDHGPPYNPLPTYTDSGYGTGKWYPGVYFGGYAPPPAAATCKSPRVHGHGFNYQFAVTAHNMTCRVAEAIVGDFWRHGKDVILHRGSSMNTTSWTLRRYQGWSCGIGAGGGACTYRGKTAQYTLR
jgi:hypothetical protein